jgi:crossover junction endodeoxyribonuclease RusA
VVYGLPAPQGSKRHVGKGVMIESNQQALNTWREDVKLAALRALEEAAEWDADYPAVTANIAFILPRPKAHFRTGKFAHLLRDAAPVLHGVKPDLDKLIRSTGDALTAAGVYVDDSRLAHVNATKRYPALTAGPGRGLVPEKPGARILLQGLPR